MIWFDCINFNSTSIATIGLFSTKSGNYKGKQKNDDDHQDFWYHRLTALSTVCSQFPAKNTEQYDLLHNKTIKWSMQPTKTQISRDILPVWSEFALYTQWVAKDPTLLLADSEDSDQTGLMPRLICVFAGRIHYFVLFVVLQLILKILSKEMQNEKSLHNWTVSSHDLCRRFCRTVKGGIWW